MKHLLAFLSFTFSLTAWAQDWYEIEVLIFEHNSNPYESLSDPERWPSDLNLAWPDLLMELDPVEDDLDDTEAAVEAEIDSPVQPEDLVPRPYVELPQDERRLSNANYAMRVRGQYDLLWHKSWKAPLLPEEESPWILVQAGEQFGDHFRLEGSLRVHLTRYLHLHTDLWLTELQPYDAEEQTEFHWSQLPKPEPSRWPCIFIEEEWPDSARDLPDDYYEKPAPGNWYYPFGCGSETENEADPNALTDLPVAVPAELEPSHLSVLSVSDDTALDAGGATADENPEEAEDKSIDQKTTGLPFFMSRQADPEEETNTVDSKLDVLNPEQSLFIENDSHALDSGYPVKEIVHIQSRRRMRSEELHYVDHPKVGILVIIHPVEQPVLEAEPIKFISAPLPAVRTSNPSSTVTE